MLREDDDDDSSAEGSCGRASPPPEMFERTVVRAEAPPGGREVRVALYDDTGGTSVLRGVPERRGAALLELCLVENTDTAFGSCGFSTRRIRAADIRSGVLKEFDVLMMPGGRGWHQGSALGEEGREAVRSWVQSGGGYVGICGGCNAASSDPFYLPGNALGLLPTRNADSGEGLPDKVNHRGAGAVKVTLTPAGSRILGADIGSVYYHNGPVIQHVSGERLGADGEDESGMQVLALYAGDIARTKYARDIRFKVRPGVRMEGQAAVCCARFGEGRVAVFGPHPERPLGKARRKRPEKRQDGPPVGWRSASGSAASDAGSIDSSPSDSSISPFPDSRHWVRNIVAWASGAF
eukprot:Hpha_TRINITY_DN33689_c0_g1::TRINITY_DN33689_c0_g1_i1::g.43339::m.43339